jgi:hypothetical protein
MSSEEDVAGSTNPPLQEDEAKKAVLTNDLPLEWTQLNDGSTNIRPIRYPSDVFEYSNNPEENYLEIIGTSGQKITNMGKDLYRTCSPNLTHLIFRSHLIKKMEGIKDFKKLELLELYDNQIEFLDELGCEDTEEQNAGETIKTLDMSYNVIREMEPVHFCPNLVDLCEYSIMLCWRLFYICLFCSSHIHGFFTSFHHCLFYSLQILPTIKSR